MINDGPGRPVRQAVFSPLAAAAKISQSVLVMSFFGEFPDPDLLWRDMDAATRSGETASVEALLKEIPLDGEGRRRIAKTARRLVEKIRRRGAGQGGGSTPFFTNTNCPTRKVSC
ncbi:MAG TPA: hypothetical protein QF509_08870 [Rhodospirillales bacterium]|nr:hypothetical protein [Rhodospirillales bacterium]